MRNTIFSGPSGADEVERWRTELRSLIGKRKFPVKYEDIKDFPDVDYDYESVWKVFHHYHVVSVKANGYID
jgi:hypothetical protein